MKKSMSILVAMILAMLLCGCNSDVPDLTPEQTALISEYATHLLVKHSELSDRSLLDERELEEGMLAEAQERERQAKADEIAKTYLNDEAEIEDEVVEEEPEEEDVEIEDPISIAPSHPIAEFLGEDSFVIEYDSYELCESYPSAGEDDFYMTMDAATGKKLCVLKFLVSNPASEDRELDLIGKKVHYLLKVPGSKEITAQTTMLLDDISSYKGTISGNATQQMALVFEVDDSITQMDDSKLIIKYESGENIISL